jgi:hypothetical protein
MANMRLAMTTLRSLPPLTKIQADGGVSVDFQLSTLQIRVSFLELITSARQLTREMRLMGTGPKKYTRPYVHLNNIIKQFFSLGNEHLKVYRQYGLFICQQSRSVLRTLRVLCVFVGKSLQRAFHEFLSDASQDKCKKITDTFEGSGPKGDCSQPLIPLLKQLQSMAVNDMDESVDEKIRATVMLQIMDGILKSPFPFPKAMFTTKKIPRANLQVLWDPNKHGHSNQQIGSNGSFVLLASGIIPASLLRRANIPFNIVLVWYILTRREVALKKERNQKSCNHSEQSLQRLFNTPPAACSLPPSGSFSVKIVIDTALHKGTYDIEVRLGCRDLRGGEWEIPIASQPPILSINVRG